MNIKFIGTGGAFDYEYLNSSALVAVGDNRVLIDCGHAIYPALRKKKTEGDIDYVVITHLHDDHIGSLSTLLIHNLYFNNKKLKLLYPQEEFLADLNTFLTFTLQEPSKFVDYKPISEVKDIGFIDTYGKHVAGFQTFAYYFEEDDERIVYSGDLGDCDTLFAKLNKLETKKTTVFHDTTFIRDNKAHTYFGDLITYRNKYEIYGYHCDPRENPKNNPIPLVQNHTELLL